MSAIDELIAYADSAPAVVEARANVVQLQDEARKRQAETSKAVGAVTLVIRRKRAG